MDMLRIQKRQFRPKGHKNIFLQIHYIQGMEVTF
jgi:hypothetical protein